MTIENTIACIIDLSLVLDASEIDIWTRGQSVCRLALALADLLMRLVTKNDDPEAFYITRRLYRIMTVLNVHSLAHKHSISSGRHTHTHIHTYRCDLGQPVVDQGFNSAND